LSSQKKTLFWIVFTWLMSDMYILYNGNYFLLLNNCHLIATSSYRIIYILESKIFWIFYFRYLWIAIFIVKIYPFYRKLKPFILTFGCHLGKWRSPVSDLKMMRTWHALTQRACVLYMRESSHRHDVCRKSRNSVPTFITTKFYGFLQQYTAFRSRQSNCSSIQLMKKFED